MTHAMNWGRTAGEQQTNRCFRDALRITSFPPPPHYHYPPLHLAPSLVAKRPRFGPIRGKGGGRLCVCADVDGAGLGHYSPERDSPISFLPLASFQQANARDTNTPHLLKITAS